MVRSGNEISRRWKGFVVRTTSRRWKAEPVPAGDQYDGISAPYGDGVTTRQYRRTGPGDSVDPQSQTTHGSARRLESAQARNSSSARATKTCKGRRVPGSRPSVGQLVQPFVK